MNTSFQIEEASIREIQKAVDNKTICYKDLILSYLQRISACDKKGPAVNSVLEINPDAIQIAQALDMERKTKGLRSAMHGIPVLVKDNIDTADKMHTSAGSLVLKDSYAKEDAFLVAQLRAAGTVILGKTNMTEWANYMTEGMPPGYSSRGGLVLNPYGRQLSPGGSSTGSGVASACSFCAAAVGTGTSGSITSPACDNAIVGIKPTVGLISRTGIIPVSHSQDTAGPMARTVEDAAILLGAMVGVDEKDPVSHTSRGKYHTDYTQFLDPNGLAGKRIGIPRDFYYEGLTKEELFLIQNALVLMQRKGAVIIDPVIIPTARELQSEKAILYELKVNMDYYLANLSFTVPVHSLSQLIQYNDTDPKRLLKYKQKKLIEAEKTSGTLTEAEYIVNKLKDIELSTRKGLDPVMARNDLDALLFPGHQGVEIIAKSGYPSVTVPIGFMSDGMPFGLTFAAQAYREPLLIEIGYSFEQCTKGRKPPKLKVKPPQSAVEPE